MAQDYYDPLQFFDGVVELIDANKADLGLRYIALLDDDLISEYPAVMISMEGSVQRERHSTRMFNMVVNLHLFVLHNDMTVGKGIRSRKDIELATKIRKLLQQNSTLDGHILDSFVPGEFPGQVNMAMGTDIVSVVATRLHWQGQNRVPYEAS